MRIRRTVYWRFDQPITLPYVSCVGDIHPELTADTPPPTAPPPKLRFERAPRWSERNVRRAMGRDREQAARALKPCVGCQGGRVKVYAVMDASGDPSEMASRTSLARFVQGGVIPTTTNAVLSEIHHTWNRPEAAEIGGLYAHVSPNYAAVVESYQKAQDVAKQAK